MKGYRFLRDKLDVIQAGDEFRNPGKPPRWEAPGEHVIGLTYTRKFMVLTFRRPVPDRHAAHKRQGKRRFPL